MSALHGPAIGCSQGEPTDKAWIGRAEDIPPLGGWWPGAHLEPREHRTLAALADEMIPAGGGFPAPSAVGVVDFVARYVAPEGREARWYPFLAEADLHRRLGDLADEVDSAEPGRVSEVVSGLERSDPVLFARLRELVYFGYYSRPAVIAVINGHLPAAPDYRITPQPLGYSEMPAWDERLLARVRGSYTATDAVSPVDVSGLGLRQGEVLAGRRGGRRDG